MRKWWRRLKHRRGWDFIKCSHMRYNVARGKRERIYTYQCKYCGLRIVFTWEHTLLAYHNMQRHLRARHDVL